MDRHSASGMVGTRCLTAILARLTDRALADSMIGDLEEGRRRRGRLWFAGAAVALVAHLAARRGYRALRSAPATLRASGLAAEARQSLRGLARTPVITSVIVLTLALGFGLNTAIFSVVHGVLFDPLPFERSGELVLVQGSRRGSPPAAFGTSYPDYPTSGRRRPRFATSRSAPTGRSPSPAPRFRSDSSASVSAGRSSRRSGCGRPPAAGSMTPTTCPAGRKWSCSVTGCGCACSAAIRRRSDAILDLNGLRARVVGVMPAAFRFPFDDVELWAPARNELDSIPRNSRFLMTFGRLRSGVRAIDADAELTRLAAALETAHPDTNR